MPDRHSVIPAVFVILERDGKVLLIRRANTGWRNGHYTVPAGHLEGGESMKTAAIRETAEEVGVEILEENLTFVCMIHRPSEEQDGTERVSVFFKAADWQGVPINNEPHKADDIGWFEYDSLPEKMVPSCLLAFKMAQKGESYGDVGF